MVYRKDNCRIWSQLPYLSDGQGFVDFRGVEDPLAAALMACRPYTSGESGGHQMASSANTDAKASASPARLALGKPPSTIDLSSSAIMSLGATLWLE